MPYIENTIQRADLALDYESPEMAEKRLSEDIEPGQARLSVAAAVLLRKYRFVADFHKLAQAWRKDIGGQSNPNYIYSSIFYTEILKMGLGVVPLILEDMANGPKVLWHPALVTLTGYDLAGVEHLTSGEIIESWLDWGRLQGLIK